MLRSALALAFTAVIVHAADWPQYRGPFGDGSTSDKISTTWASEPKILWKVPGGTGFSSFVVAGNRCFTLEGRDQGGLHEVLVARDVDTGKELWTADLGAAAYEGGGNDGARGNNGGDGPRSTPAVAGNAVVTINAELVVSAHDAATGKPLWTRDLMKEHVGRNIAWKNAASPVVDDGIVYVGGGGAGQSFLALDPKTGAVLAKAGDDTITHATPTVATILGQRQIIFFTKSGLNAFEPKTLKPLWHADFPFNISTAASPVVLGDTVYCSAGYAVGAGAFKISKAGSQWKAEQIGRWPGNKPLANHWSTPVASNGFLYGMFQFKQYGRGPLKCVAMPGGEVKWEKEGFGPGQVVLNNARILALSDAGELVVVAANPDAYTEIVRAKVIDGKCWSTPVISNGRVFLHSTKEATCLDLRESVAAK
jgi:outer membrane protein assembly factor BamB